MTDAKQVASIIYRQIGGNRFKMMTGSHTFVCGKEEKGQCFISMSLSENKLNADFLKIRLEYNDTYTMIFQKIDMVILEDGQPKDCVINSVREIDHVYCDMLEDVFEHETGLYTRI